MKIVETTKYDFCGVCNVYGCTHMIEFCVMTIKHDLSVLVCKDCAEQLGKKSEDLK